MRELKGILKNFASVQSPNFSVPSASEARRTQTEVWTLNEDSAFYKAILQNLFFATLNTDGNDSKTPRKFRNKKTEKSRYDQNVGVSNLFRYESEFINPQETLEKYFLEIPFLNGGLFECLDKPEEKIYIDGFSERKDNPLSVPDDLFFSDEVIVDLSEVYNDKKKSNEKVRGLIRILDNYKFTIAENTPIEEEIALDPELLGKVFENLLANYNPETRTTARKQTGSFYTPREIVNYMVDESLIAYLKAKLEVYRSTVQSPRFSVLPASEARRAQTEVWTLNEAEIEADLRDLFNYSETEHKFSDAEIDVIIKAINDCKILDPACGSGAFPMGILQRLVFLLGKLDKDNVKWRELQKLKAIEETEEAYNIGNVDERNNRLKEISDVFEFNSSDYGRKLFLIENCIYGVDIQPVAIQIAKLRFFISLIIDQKVEPLQKPARSKGADGEEHTFEPLQKPARSKGADGEEHTYSVRVSALPNRGVRPLPNLETKLVAANTLLSLEAQAMLKPSEVPALEKELKEVRSKIFRARTPSTKLKWRMRDKEIRTTIADLLKQTGYAPDAADKIANWSPDNQDAHADWFDAEWMFGIEKGFDIVIGNPPYVRQEQIIEFKEYFRENYDCFVGTADLFVYFYERGIKHLSDKGVLTFITSNKYFRSGYGVKLREFLTRNATLKQVIDFGDTPIFTAIAYPSILIAVNQKPNGNQVGALVWNATEEPENFAKIYKENHFEIAQKELKKEGWQLENVSTLKLLEKLRTKGTSLGEYINGNFYRGVTTGLNEAFVVNRETRDRLIAEDASSAEILKPFLRGRDVKRWQVNYADLWLIFTRHGTNIEQFPAIKNYLLQFKDKLMPGVIGGRKIGSYKWFEIQDNTAYWKAFEEAKIIVPAIEKSCCFTFDENGFFGNDKTSIYIHKHAKFILGCLNSTISWYLVKQKFATKQGGYFEFKPMYVSQLPIPKATDAQQAAIACIVDEIIEAKKADAKADTKDLERKIDELVYQLYELTPEEIAIVEGQEK